MKYAWLILFTVFTFSVHAQKRALKLADKAFQNYDFMDARERYKELLPAAGDHPVIYKRLADTYYVNSEYKEAARYYHRYLNRVNSAAPAVWLRFVAASGSVQKWREDRLAFAKKLDEYLLSKGYSSDLQAQVQDTTLGTFEVWKIGFSTKADELGGSIHHITEELYFTARYKGKEHNWSGQAFMDIYRAHKKSDRWEVAGPVEGKINKKYHESSPSFSAGGGIMYFTRSEFDGGNVARLKLFRARWKDSTWQEPEKLSINMAGYSSSHAVESPDGKYLYFASDRPGGLKLADDFIPTSDIWRVEIFEDGFGKPGLVLGVNSFGMDTFPFMDSEGNLYFASNGRAGKGGLDIYFAEAKKDGTFKIPQLLAAPLNSPQDDFGFFQNLNGKQAFFTSDRFGDDDIYEISSFKLFDCNAAFQAIVVDAKTKMPLPGAQVSFELGSDFASDTGKIGWTEIAQGVSDSLARYSHPVICSARYRITAGLKGYSTEQEVFKTNDENSDLLRIVLALKEEEKIPQVGEDLRTALNLQPIYFDLDKAYIRKDARETLDPIAAYLNNNPAVRISIESHTDSRGKAIYNQQLSQRRAKSTYEYLVEQGVNPGQMEYVGKGESELVNKCSDGVDCPEEKHQENRRSIFKIIQR